MYLPTTKQLRKDQKVLKHWRFLRKQDWISSRPFALWLLLPLAFGVTLWCVCPHGPDGLEVVWYLDALFMVVGIALTVPSIVCVLKLARRPTALRFAGSCYSCGAARIEGTDACNHCGAEFAEQDVHHSAMLHASDRFQQFTLIDRRQLRFAVRTYMPVLLGMGAVLPILRHINESASEYPYLCFSLTAGLFFVAFGGGGLLMSRSWRRYHATLDTLHKSCLVCGAGDPPEYERLEWCPACEASYVWQRASREDYVAGRVARERLRWKRNMRLAADRAREDRGK